MSVKASDVVKRFFIFCPNFGRKEGEEERKILFYYPQHEEIDVKLRTVGYSEACNHFASNFTGGHQPYTEIGTTRDVEVTTRVEKEYFASFGCDLEAASAVHYSVRADVLSNVLQRLCDTFKLFFGTFDSHVVRLPGKPPNADGLRKCLNYFCARYFSLLRFHVWSLMDVLDGANKMFVDTETFLKVQSIVNVTTERFPNVGKSLMLCNDCLIWHCMPNNVIKVLYRYLIDILLPKAFRIDLQPETRRRTGTASINSLADDEVKSSNVGSFVLGSAFIIPATDGSEIDYTKDGCPKLFTESESGVVEQHYLVVYRVQNVVYVLLVPVDDASFQDSTFLPTLDSEIGNGMSDLAACLMEQHAQKQNDSTSGSSQTTPPYLYYDAADWTLYCTYDSRSTDEQSPPYRLFGSLCDVRQEALRQTPSVTSSQQKLHYAALVSRASDGDYWLAVKMAGARQLYAVVARKNAATLVEVNDEVNKLCTQRFESQFLIE